MVKPLESKDVKVTSRDAVIVVAPGVTQSWKIGYDFEKQRAPRSSSSTPSRNGTRPAGQPDDMRRFII